MKKAKCLVIVMILFLVGCAHTLNQIEDKWGKPARVERTENTITYFYYFNRGRLSSGVGTTDITAGRIVVEFIANNDGKVIKERKYWEQPKE
jgi:hypothetical protein